MTEYRCDNPERYSAFMPKRRGGMTATVRSFLVNRFHAIGYEVFIKPIEEPVILAFKPATRAKAVSANDILGFFVS